MICLLPFEQGGKEGEGGSCPCFARLTHEKCFAMACISM